MKKVLDYLIASVELQDNASPGSTPFEEARDDFEEMVIEYLVGGYELRGDLIYKDGCLIQLVVNYSLEKSK